MGSYRSYLFGLMLVAFSLTSQVRAQDDQCTVYSCVGWFCAREFKPAGTACAEHGECDGRGVCVVRNPCGDGKWDSSAGEACDASSPEWSESAGACNDSCQLTRKVYGSCAKGGEACWAGGYGWFCSALGACTRLCNSDAECGGGGRCVQDPINKSQHLCTVDNCGPGTRQQWVGRQGCFDDDDDSACRGAPSPVRLCGWLSVDPSTNRLWCPAESSPCCAPEEFGGPGSGSMCIK
jgi:hypothetical protein